MPSVIVDITFGSAHGGVIEVNGESVNGGITLKSDTHDFTFMANAGDTYVVSQKARALDLTTEVFDSNGNQLGSTNDYLETISFIADTTGTYSVKASYAGVAFDCYSLKVKTNELMVNGAPISNESVENPVYYSFNGSNGIAYTVRQESTMGDANLELYDQSNNLIGQSSFPIQNALSISALEPSQRYYIAVIPVNSSLSGPNEHNFTVYVTSP